MVAAGEPAPVRGFLASRFRADADDDDVAEDEAPGRGLASMSGAKAEASRSDTSASDQVADMLSGKRAGSSTT